MTASQALCTSESIASLNKPCLAIGQGLNKLRVAAIFGKDLKGGGIQTKRLGIVPFALETTREAGIKLDHTQIFSRNNLIFNHLTTVYRIS